MENSNYSDLLIEPNDLMNKLDKDKYPNFKNLRILDATIFPPGDPRDKYQAFKEKRIPCSQYFDIDKVSNLEIPFPHMMPSGEVFTENMKKMDVRLTDEIVVYDRVGMFSAPRAWYTLRLFGHKNVKVLNGGLPYYESKGGRLEGDADLGALSSQRDIRDIPGADSFNYVAFEAHKIGDGRNIIEKGLKIEKGIIANEEIIDARNEKRYKGEVDEPRKSLRVGHVLGAKNVPFQELLDENSRYLEAGKIKEVFEKHNVDGNKKVSAYCGTGLTAVIDLLAGCIVGKEDSISGYDGSWIEYGNVPEEEFTKIKSEIKLN